MTDATLHYIHDPFCGWCYGAAPLVKAARAVVTVRAHGGGMMAGARRQHVSAQLRDYVLPHDRRIAQLTGQPFGDAYANGLLRDTTAVFDSEPAIAAVLAGEEVANRGLDLLARLQEAHYVEGLRIADEAVLVEQASALGIDARAFTGALRRALASEVQAHIAATRELMARTGAQGFPTFVLETEAGFTRVDAASFLGQPQRFAEWLRARVPAMQSEPAAAEAFGCGPEACAI